jgi:outer membrane protein TolC
MNFTRIVASVVLAGVLALPGMASSNWVDDFLHRYESSGSVPSQPNSPQQANLSQLLKTGEVPITLNDVINMMIDNNLAIRTDRFAPRSSYLQSIVFYQALLPALRISSNIGRNNVLSTTQLNGASSNIQDTLFFDANVAQLLPTGTSVSVDLAMNRLQSSSNNSIFNPSYTGKLTYTVGQHLLQNRGRLINMNQILQAQNTEKISEAALELQLTSLIVQAQSAYWDLVFAEQDLNVKQRSLDRAQIELEQDRTKVEIGTLAPVDVVQTEGQVANVSDQLVQSQSAITTAGDQIKKLVSSEKNPSLFLINLRALESPLRPEAVQIPTLEEAVRIALENRPEMRQAILDLKNKDLNVNYTKNQKLPVFDVTGSYTQNGTGGTQRRGFLLGTPPLNPAIPGGVFDSLGQLFSYGYNGFSAGFNLTIPLNNKAANAAYEKALNDQRMSQSTIDTVGQQIALDVRNALTQVGLYKARIDTAKTARELSQRVLDAEQDKFNLGTSTLRFVLDDQNNLAQAQSNEVLVLVNFTKALVGLDQAMGMTLKKNNIELEKMLNSNSGTTSR